MYKCAFYQFNYTYTYINKVVIFTFSDKIKNKDLFSSNKMKIKIVWTVLRSKRKIVEKGKIYTPNTQIHDRSHIYMTSNTHIHDRSHIYMTSNTHIYDRSLSLSFIHIITITINIQQNLSTLNIFGTNGFLRINKCSY